MVGAAAALGIESQLCMACPHQIMASLEQPGVTNARANGDGGRGVGDLIFTTVLAAAMGVGWSKDNLRLAPPGIGAGFTELQTLLTALSLGPVGLSDELVGYPAPLVHGATPAVVTNVTLALSTCSANGTLLAPSFPLTPLEPLLLGAPGLGHKCVGEGGGARPALRRARLAPPAF